VLFDSGGTNTLIHSKCLPKGATPVVLKDGPTKLKTIAGDFVSTQSTYLKDLVLPEFDKTGQVEGIVAFIFDAPCNYDVILGRDFLRKAGIDLSFKHGTVKWLEKMILMKDRDHWDKQENWFLTLDEEDEDDEDDELESYATEILDAKYDKTSPNKVVKLQTHLNDHQQAELQKVLEIYPALFDGTLGLYPHQQIHLELEKDATPSHARPYAVPKANDAVFKKKL
jgi:hypothetical protein